MAAKDPAATAQPGSDWELVWNDEFDGTGLPDAAKWTYDVGGHGWGNNEKQFYTQARLENARQHDGKLHITARREAWEGNDYTSARVISSGLGDFQYGRFEIRAKLPAARGSWAAIWMMPSDWDFSQGGWPDVGEIDIMEHVGHDPGVIHASAHSRDYQWQKGTQKTGTISVPRATEAFHTYVLEWSENRLAAYVDDALYFEYLNEGDGEGKWPYVKPFYLILNVAVGGEWGMVKGIDEAAFPQTMEVDYVRVYRATH
ncbi:glycoside hydrolase family 16 protein [Actomonas aquatica]|uniref:Glycoside hydrolase family 16 protein n=1 Tax=Actomonas aquatica TaxID=2866162 RepID=A0ABZ1C522_9BACT|nr:glycoside hydrolase family 16 protein [Opitutus sp. WL0086]WRQ85614.1 glycoside hydrolase family 16 protein [Opitutus sp. WL0086]